MSKKPCHTIIFSFRVVGPQSLILRVTKLSRFLRYPQDTSHLLYYFHVHGYDGISTKLLKTCKLEICKTLTLTRQPKSCESNTSLQKL